MVRMPAESMLAQPVDTFALPAGWAAEPKWDGFRVLLAHDQEQTLLRSRDGTCLTGAFPELIAAAAALPYDVVLDGGPATRPDRPGSSSLLTATARPLASAAGPADVSHSPA